MFRIRSITYDNAAVRGLPAGSLEVNSNEVTFITITREEDRVRCCLCKINKWAVVNLNPLAVCLQEQNISIRHFQGIGYILKFSARIVRILTHGFPPLL